MNIRSEHFSVGHPKTGPFVLVLQDGAQITAEDRAMLQALYSRSPASVLDHLRKLEEVGSGKFMDQYYVGYGHKSIGDCGDTTIFIENVSMLVAKAIQDWALYNGQEFSTRYLDFSTQPFVNPLLLPLAESPQESLRQFYLESLPILKNDLKKRFPVIEGEKVNTYDKAVDARAFDILRGFLPAGAQTNLAWTTNLRQAADKLMYLRAHPLDEVRIVARMIEEALKKAHPHSFNQKRYKEAEIYRERYMREMYYFKPSIIQSGIALTKNSIDLSLLTYYKEVFESRPDKTELPKALAEIGTVQFEFLLDFGSFRDIARQRAVIQRMPLVTTEYGFHKWYLSELPEILQHKAEMLLTKIEYWWRQAKEVNPLTAQYYLPMGYLVPCRVSGDLPALIYLVELRSGTSVHPTLREIAQGIGSFIEDLGIKVYIDRSHHGRFDVRRGVQDIVIK